MTKRESDSSIQPSHDNRRRGGIGKKGKVVLTTGGAALAAAAVFAASGLGPKPSPEKGKSAKPTAEQIYNHTHYLAQLPLDHPKNFGESSVVVDPQNPNLTDVTFQPTERHPLVSDATELIAPDQVQQEAYQAFESYNDGSSILNGPVTVRVDNGTGNIIPAPTDSSSVQTTG